MAGTKNTVREGFDLQDSLEFLANSQKITEEFEDQYAIMKKILGAANKLKLPFDQVTGNIGKSVRDLKLFESTEKKLSQTVTDRSLLESNLSRQLKSQTVLASQLSRLKKLEKNAAFSTAEMNKEILNKTRQLELLRAAGAKITPAMIKKEEAAIRDKYKNVSKLIPLYKETAKENRAAIKDTKKILDTYELQEKKLEQQNALFSSGKLLLDQMGDLGKHISDLKFPNWIDVIKKGFSNFLEFDKAAFSFRKSVGLVRGEFSQITDNIRSIGIEFSNLGVDFEMAQKSATAIADQFNLFTSTSKEALVETSVLAAQLGVSAEESEKFRKAIASVGSSTRTAQKGMTGFAKELATAAGIPLSKIMQDVADAGDDIRIFLGNSVEKLIKGSVQARQMGISLQKAAISSKSLLDFQTSIADEMEASVLLGRDVNLQQARNLSYRKDLIGQTQEILRISKLINFDALDPYQAEAFAKATGKSLTELQDMIQADKEISFIRNGSNDVLKKQLVRYEDLKKLRLEESKDVGRIAEQHLKEQYNQERVNALSQQFNKLLSELAEPVMDVVEPLLGLAVAVMPTLIAASKVLIGAFAAWGSSSVFATLGGISTSIGAWLTGLAATGGLWASIASVVGWIGGALTTIGSSAFLPFIGAGLAIYGIIKNVYDKWQDIVAAFNRNWWEGILTGLNAVGEGVFKGLLAPFKFAFDLIDKHWMGHSPSEIGLGILRGIESIGPMLIDSLIAPFRFAFNSISGMFNGPKLPKFTENISANVVSESNSSLDKQADAREYTNAIMESNKQVVNKLDQLINLLMEGRIAVNMDGTKVSSALVKSVNERGLRGAI